MLASRIPRQAYVASCAADFSKWPLAALETEYARVKAAHDDVTDLICVADDADVEKFVAFRLVDFVVDPSRYPASDLNRLKFYSRADVQSYFYNIENLQPHFMADKLRGLAAILEVEQARYEKRVDEGYFDNTAFAQMLSGRMSVIEEFMCCAPCGSLEDATVKLRFATDHLTNIDCDWDERDLIIKSVLSFLSTVKQDTDTSTALQVAALESVAEKLG
jgi:hypothetical protein